MGQRRRLQLTQMNCNNDVKRWLRYHLPNDVAFGPRQMHVARGSATANIIRRQIPRAQTEPETMGLSIRQTMFQVFAVCQTAMSFYMETFGTITEMAPAHSLAHVGVHRGAPDGTRVVPWDLIWMQKRASNTPSPRLRVVTSLNLTRVAMAIPAGICSRRCGARGDRHSPC